MGIALFTFDKIIGRLQRALGTLVPQPARVPARAAQAAQPRRVAALPPPKAVRRPVRVVRVIDSACRDATGRLVISGRLADVCAELERLAAQETAQALAPTR